MARTIGIFSPLSAEPTTGTYPELVEVNSTERRKGLAYDAAAVEIAAWTFIAPQGLTTPLTAIISFCMASATSGNVILGAALEAVSDTDTVDLDSTASFDTNNASSAIAVPGTAGYIKQASITLTNNDSVAAGDLCRLRIQRDGASGSDTAAGDLYLLEVELRDAA